jgi:hypothetical protein
MQILTKNVFDQGYFVPITTTKLVLHISEFNRLIFSSISVATGSRIFSIEGRCNLFCGILAERLIPDYSWSSGFQFTWNENPEMATNGSGMSLCVKPLDDLVFIIHGLSPKAELFIGDLERINKMHV